MTAIKFSVIVLFIFISSEIRSQVSTQWRNFYNGSSNDSDVITSMTIDNQNFICETGYSTGSENGRDIAIVKYDQTGQQVWALTYNNSNSNLDDVPSDITVDATGNVYVTGYTTGTNSFKDFITIKYSPDGQLLWTAVYNGKGNDDDVAAAVQVDGLGNVYVTGFSVGSATSEDYATIKYNSSGSQRWVSAYNNDLADDIDIATSLLIDQTGNIYVTGYSIGSGTEEDYATVKYNTLGEELWNKRYNSSANSYDITTGMALDGSGNLLVTGYNFSSESQEDYVTVKYSSSGDELWTARYNGSSNSFDIARAIAIDNAGNVFITGYSYDNTSFENYATVKYNPIGEQQWAAIYNGTGGDFDIATSINTDSKGNVYVTGYSYDFNTLENYATIKYNNDGQQLWEEIFNGETNGSDIARTIVLDNAGNVYVAGHSYEGATGVDFVTIKYSQTVGINSYTTYAGKNFRLSQNYPNPFNPSTIITYDLSSANFVSLKIYNSLGIEVASLVNEKQSAGSYSVNFDGSNLSSGIYFYRLEVNPDKFKAENYNDTKRMLLLK